MKGINYFSFLFIFLSLGYGSVYSQHCSEFILANSTSEEFIEIRSSRTFEKKGEESLLLAKEQLKKELQLLMSESIMTKVTGVTDHSIKETNGNVSEFFQTQMKIETSTSLGFADVDYCIDKKAKVIWGKYRIQRRQLATATLQNCISQMTALNAEIQGIISSDSKVDVQSLKQRYLILNRDYQSALYLNPEIDTKQWNALIDVYNNEMVALSSSQDQIAFNHEFDQAKSKLKSGQYYDALLILNRLKIDHFYHEELTLTIENAKSNYKDYVIRRCGELMNQRDFEKGLQVLSQYCGIVNCDESINSLRQEISRKYFKELAEKIRSAIKFKEEISVEKLKTTIDQFRDIDKSAYQEICNEYNDFHIELGMQRVASNIAKEEYWLAYALIKELENRYGKRDSELLKLKSSIERRILKEAVQEEKKQRPKLLSTWVGVDLNFNDVDLGSLKNYTADHYYFGYHVGLYWKYKFEKNYKKSYPVRSDFIGVRMRMLDYGSATALVDSLDNELSATKSLPAHFDLGIDGITFRVLHYGLALHINENWDFRHPKYYQATIGFRLPISIFSWMTDVHLKSSLQGKGWISLSSGLSLRFDYQRKFSRKDKKRIRADKFS